MWKLAILVLMAASAPGAETAEYSLRTWRTQDGLPQNRIQAISQTADGYLWIGTPTGLARFDGLRFTLFDRLNTPAFRDDSILSLCVGRDNTLWIGTEGGGLVEYRGGTFRAYGAEAGLNNGFVRALLEDAEGQLWIGTDRGYFRRTRAGVVERVAGAEGMAVAAITGLQQDQKGRVWAVSNLGPLVAEGETVRRYAEVGSGAIRGVLAGADGSIWMARPGEIWRVQTAGKPKRVATANVVARTLREGRDGTMWVGTVGSGLLQLAGGALRKAPMPALPDQTVLTIFEDRDASLWVGTEDGLVRITRTVIRTLAGRHGLPNDNISTIYQDRDGSVWLGSISPEMGRWTGTSERALPVKPPAPGFRSRMVYRDRKGGLWYGSSGDGVAHVTAAATAVYTRRQGLRSNSARQILEDREGQIWVGLGSGLSRWDGERFHHYYLEEGLAYGSVRSLLELRNGDLLVGTDGGVNRVRGRKIVADASLDGLRGEKVWTMMEDPVSGVWFGTRGSGIYRLRDGALRRFSMREGLPGNVVYQLLDDRMGSLWMSGSFGVASVKWADLNRGGDGLAVSSYGMAEGLESTGMNGGMQPAGWRTDSGELWFASVKGAVRIRPDAPRAEHLSKVFVEAVRADEDELKVGGAVTVPAGRRKVEIAFTVCDLLATQPARFRYKLDGFDANWTHESPRRTAVYTNLPPGSYRFRVASLDTRVPEASMALTIEPYFHQTEWFQGVVLAGVGLAIWGAFRLYARQTQMRFAVQLAERTRLAREMHDTVIQGCVGVSALLEGAATAEGGRQDLVDMARQQIRLTLDEARQAVWDLRHGESEGDLPASLRDFTGRFAQASAVPIELEVSGAPARVDGLAERNLLLVAREAIRNALAHGAPRRIDLRLSFEGAGVCLEVRDDGSGFDPSPGPAPGHFGILGMRERVEELGGSLEIESERGRGTRLQARLPLRVRPE